MWNVNGAYSFHALDMGAVEVAGLDVRAPTEECEGENRRRGARVRFVQGDVNDPGVVAALGSFDVVFCSGLLYHVPNPCLTLERLRALCGDTLILGSSVIRERRLPHAAVYYPLLSERQRRRLTFRSPHSKIGLDTPYRPEWDYSNYFWGLTPSCVRAMVKTVGFEPREEYRWRRAVGLVCTTIPDERPSAALPGRR
jgi:hypothetical protein